PKVQVVYLVKFERALIGLTWGEHNTSELRSLVVRVSVPDQMQDVVMTRSCADLRHSRGTAQKWLRTEQGCYSASLIIRMAQLRKAVVFVIGEDQDPITSRLHART